MKFEFDKPTSERDIVKGAEIYLKSGTIESYDPVLLLEVQNDNVLINNGLYNYYTNLDEIDKIVLCTRSPHYDEEIDVIWCDDVDHVTIWENKDE